MKSQQKSSWLCREGKEGQCSLRSHESKGLQEGGITQLHQILRRRCRRWVLPLCLLLTCKLTEGQALAVALFSAPNSAIPAPAVIRSTSEADVQRPYQGNERDMGPSPCWRHWVPLMEKLLHAWHCARNITNYIPCSTHTNSIWYFTI